MTAMEFLNKNDRNWLFAGVNFSIPGDGGPNCTDFSTMGRRWVEGAIFVMAATIQLTLVYRNCGLPDMSFLKFPQKDRLGRNHLLLLTCIVFGMQIGFKCSSKTAIYLLNPCHVTTAIQIYLLAAAPSKLSAAIFRFHLGLMNGGVVALAFPVTNTLFLPLETEIFFIQHLLILLVPCYLVHIGGPYSLDNLNGVNWACATFSAILYYHSVILPIIALPIQVNLSQVLCPAITDPFYGPNYRIWAVIHQGIFVPFLVKLFVSSASMLKTFPLMKIKAGFDNNLSCMSDEVSNNNVIVSKWSEITESS